MQQGHQQLVVVVDEHGGGAGIVTLENLLVELVGQIYDEKDGRHSGAQISASSRFT